MLLPIISIVFIVEATIFLFLSSYTISQINNVTDTQLISKIEIPGQLLVNDQIDYNSFKNLGFLSGLTNEKVTQSLIIKDNTIFYANQPALEGQKATDVLRRSGLTDLLNIQNDSRESKHVVKHEGDLSYLSVITPLYQDKTKIGDAYLKIDITDLEKHEQVVTYTLYLISILCIVLTTSALTIFIRRRVIKPLSRMVAASNKIAEGDLTSSVLVESNDELGALATSFNKMTDSLHTSGRRLYDEHARLEASINSLSVGLLMTFVGSDAFTYNPAALHILGINNDTMQLKAATPLTVDLLQPIIKGFDLNQAIENAQKKGMSFHGQQIPYGNKIISFSGTPIVSNTKRILGAIILLEDITEAKVMERSKDEFFSIASHELRTPLTSIKGNAAMVMEYYGEELKDPDLREMISDIRLSSERLIEIVNDFLDLSRLEQGKVNFKWEVFSLEEILESVVYEMKTVLAQKHLHLTFDKMTLDSLPKIWADKNRVKQIVYNLVGNASKFTEVGGISISAAVKGELIKVLVTDTGRGIPDEGQKLLFHKFQQATNSLLTRDTTRGTGLGLYISKMLIENMGGSIALEHSQLGKGTTFSFTLPIATDKIRAEQSAETTAQGSSETDSISGLTAHHDKQKPKEP
jgi:signal transduction histidine kinase